MSEDEPNREQASYWNQQAGPRWVAMARDLDGQLGPLGLTVANELSLRSGERVLDVGCGAGATSLMLAERVRPGQVVGVDISGPLLELARQRSEGIDNVRFELGDAQTFALEPRSFDAIYSRFGVMFFADPVAAFENLRASLRGGGKLGFVCWRPMTDNPSFLVPLQAALPLLPEPPQPPEPNAPGPFAFADQARVRDILDRAGYEQITIAPHDSSVVFGGRSDIDGAVELALQIGPLGRALTTLPEAIHPQVRAAVRDAFVPYHGPSGVTLPAATWIVTARAPSDRAAG